jgi:hypothetical protein
VDETPFQQRELRHAPGSARAQPAALDYASDLQQQQVIPTRRLLREPRHDRHSRNAPFLAQQGRSVCGRLRLCFSTSSTIDEGSGQDLVALADVGWQGLAVSERATPT